MKKLLISAVAVGALFAQPTVQELQKQINNLQTQLKQLSQNQQDTADNLQQVKRAHYEDHINFHYDLRSSLDYLYYKMKDGTKYANTVLSNRVILTGLAKVDDNLKATLKLVAYNIFGMSNSQSGPYDNTNSTASETPDDTNIRVQQAFFNYFFGDESQYMISAGRRPTIGGYPANLREGDAATSPVAHLINMEFDGFSFWMKPGAFGSLGENYGTNLKFCFGRAYSSNEGKFNQTAPYIKGDEANSNIGVILFVPYNDDQYSVWSENMWAWHLPGYQGTSTTTTDVGTLFGTNLIFKADGIGNDGFDSDWLNNFLDDTKAFISFAYSKTSPEHGKTMLGSSSSKDGASVWIGADMDGFGDNDRWGLNYVHGSKYYRSITYGEDTLAGSIAAVRGSAYDAYYIKQLRTNLTASLRATYLNYNHAGSNAFFGDMGNPDQANYVDQAVDIRAYIRYNF